MSKYSPAFDFCLPECYVLSAMDKTENKSDISQPATGTPVGISRRDALRLALTAAPMVLLLTTRPARAQGSVGSAAASG